ncbi:SDR family NAD(P)-dependent oxidoreductase [Aromatoleum petrolei]|uniref:SDR family NAD(P)-dependent oxidoreductase n=1 Tax=Aromatoleum petrolei TaxID=76116 RepID=A0ABX1MNW6_9RHOO|nr:SDR family NAD(P)-dependent oxidoreductase [Aromatoleum petrolei]NMF88020.1 SDR family NAD(P)-dependent oxidoreductase [Aromatoleum petrolei]QTQ38801.1 Short-chain dehydrogenase/reductase [Aromatoleum petrolei]
MEQRKLALIVGAGPGLGRALARRFGAAEMNVALAGRNLERLENLSIECAGIGRGARAYRCDAAREEDVQALFRDVRGDYGCPDVVVYNAGAFVARGIVETSAEEFERCWRVGCLGGFLVGREAARALLERIGQGGPGGTILFTGATASLRGSAGFHNLAVGKFGLRALAQSMARELQPKGIHVAHVVIDGRIRPSAVVEHTDTHDGDALLAPDAIAEAYFQLYRQPRSAWTQELDLRPWVERF